MRPLQNYRDFCRRFPVTTSVKYGIIIILCNIPEDLVSAVRIQHIVKRRYYMDTRFRLVTEFL